MHLKSEKVMHDDCHDYSLAPNICPQNNLKGKNLKINERYDDFIIYGVNYKTVCLCSEHFIVSLSVS